jgi:short-subunit dehydrogenase
MHVLVTGASAGIGEGIAREYAKRGAKLTLSARREDRLRELANELGGKAAVVPADLSKTSAVPALCRAAEAAHGPIDVLINNAGVQIIEHAHKTDPIAGEALLELDLASPLRLIRELLPGMRERGSGTLVNVASMAALSPVPGMLYYNAAKGGLANASEALRGELRGTGVNVVTVYPGPVHTDMGDTGLTKYDDHPSLAFAPWGTTDELAHKVVRAVELGQARVIYPSTYALSLYFPNLSRWFSLRFAPPLKSEA